ncbi:MAG: nucleotidyltransferase domain-containing protein [Nanoarchaeota archaeon]|nr:nucleotidyltransferase domain-containing protein [Nanoarchaeota archaeon]
MDMYKLKWRRLQSEIFRLMCIKSGQTLNLRSIAKALKVTPTAVSKAMPQLQKADMVTVKTSKPMNLISVKFNRDSPQAVEMKRVENLKMIYESGLSKYLFEEFPGCAIILFGSYSRGEDVWADENRSDIDIAIIGTKGKKIDLTKFEKPLERKITINYYESWAGIHTYLKNNILSGILLSGSIEL